LLRKPIVLHYLKTAVQHANDSYSRRGNFGGSLIYSTL